MAKKTKQNPTFPSWIGQRSLVAVILFVGSVLLYAGTFSHDFALDDAIVITDNVFTKAGIDGIGDIFRYDTFYGFFQDASKAQLVSGGRYRPLSLAVFAVEYDLFDGQPGSMHIVNALWYGLSVVLVYFFCGALFPRSDHRSAFVALAAGLLFLAHPIHTEAVANIKGRDEIMSLAFALAASLLVIRGIRNQRIGLLVAALPVFLLGLLSKENAITFAAVIPLTVYYFVSTRPRDWLLAALPIWVASGAYLLIRGSIVGYDLGDPLPELMNNPFLKLVNGQYEPFSAAEKSATILYNLGKYLQLLVVPYPLTHDYYPRHIPIASWADLHVILSLLGHVALVLLALWGLRKRRPYSYAIWYYFLTIAIVSNVVFPVGTNLSERFLFMPSVGFALLGGVFLHRLAERRSVAWAMGLLLVVTLIFSGLTIKRNPVWSDNYTLFSSDIEHAPNSAKLRNALGGELTSRYADGVDTSKLYLREAIGHLQEAIRIHPRYKNAYLLLGNANYYLRNFESAIAAYRSALALDPGYQEALNNLPIALRDAGRYYGEQRGDLERAKGMLTEAFTLDPGDYETARLLGVSYGISGDVQRAVEYFGRAVEIDPQQADAWFDLGIALTQAGRGPEAQSAFQRARSIDPEIDQKRRQAPNR